MGATLFHHGTSGASLIIQPDFDSRSPSALSVVATCTASGLLLTERIVPELAIFWRESNE